MRTEGEVPQAASRRPVFAPTKFVAPQVPAALIRRESLIDRLDAGRAKAISLIVAAPGSGKTSLLADWCSRTESGPTVWLALDRADADPARFWHAVVAAVQSAVPGWGSDAADLITLDQTVTHDALENLLTESPPTRVNVVIDDFHVTSPEVGRQLEHVLHRGLRNVHLVVASRHEPAIGAARLRLAGQACDINEADLRLSRHHIARYVDRLNVDLSPADVDVIHARTEGWAAGVTMATLTATAGDGPRSGLDRLLASSEAVSSYLTIELIANQPEPVRQFLDDTCIVDELTAPMLEALTQSGRSGVSPHDVEAAHLLFGRVDAAGTVFRYHPLLAGMLRTHLLARDPERFREQHRRAAEVNLRSGNIGLAARHYWLAGRSDLAAKVIRERTVAAYLGAGDVDVIDLELSLTSDEMETSPGDVAGLAMALLLSGRPAAAETMLDRAESAVDSAQLDVAERIERLIVRLGAAMGAGDTAQVIHRHRELQLEIEKTSRPDPAWTAVVVPSVVRAFAWEADFEAARRVLARNTVSGNIELADVDLAYSRALVEFEFGDLVLTEHVAAAAVDAGIRLGVEGTGATLAARAVRAAVWLETGLVDDAERELGDVVTRMPLIRAPAYAHAAIALARALRAGGHFDAAVAAVSGVRRRMPQRGTTLTSRLDALEAELALSMGDEVGARRLVDQLPDSFPCNVSRARVGLALEGPRTTAHLIERLQHAANTPRQRLEVALLGVDLADQQELPDLDQRANEALALAVEHGFVLMFAEAGTSVLRAACDAARRQPRTTFVDRLLATRPVPLPSNRVVAGHPADRLTDRELIVLRYMATSMSNQEIADALFVSVNTVKTHIKHVLRKLGAGSRPEAIRRAQAARYL